MSCSLSLMSKELRFITKNGQERVRTDTAQRARAHARAREKSLKNFRLVPLRRRYVQRRRALAVIMPIMPTSELVWLVRQ